MSPPAEGVVLENVVAPFTTLPNCKQKIIKLIGCIVLAVSRLSLTQRHRGSVYPEPSCCEVRTLATDA